MGLAVTVVCPDCGLAHDGVELGAEIRCRTCGRDFRAQAEPDGRTRVISVTGAGQENIPYSQRSVEQPVNKISTVVLADPALLADKLLRDVPVKENAKCLGKVRLLKKLGQGGMGAVYRGFEESLVLDVAVKVVPLPQDDRDQQFVERFRQEARISAKINHPNVVRTLQVDRQGDLLYLVMDYVEGQTARQLADAKGPLAVPLALQIIADAARGVQAAHRYGVVHRDIKPENILVASDGRVLISDLGLAKAMGSHTGGSRHPVTSLGLLLGTPGYMSPEQWDIGAAVGPASDIWSLGATLWLLLTRRTPFDEPELPALARAIREAKLEDIRQYRPSVPGSVVQILECCLAKKPEARYASCAELLRALDDALRTPAGHTASAAMPHKPAESAVRNSAVAAPSPAPAPASAVPAAPLAAPVASGPAVLPAVALRPETASRPARLRASGTPQTAVLAGVLAIVAAVVWLGVSAPASSGSRAPGASLGVSLDMRCPTRVKAGEEAELYAAVGGVKQPGDYAVVWQAGDTVHTGSSVRTALEFDTDFVVSVRDKNTAREVQRRHVPIRVDLLVRAAEKDFYRLEAGSAFHTRGQVRGGPEKGTGLEFRWVEAAEPETVLSLKAELDMPELETGRYTFLLQAKRAEQANWTQAATDKVTVEVVKRVPPAFSRAMRQAAEARQRAESAASGKDAVTAWRQALAAVEQACAILPDAPDAQTQGDECRRLLAQDEKYMALLSEAAYLREQAERIPENDGVRRLSAWSEALRRCTAALALFDRPEARARAESIQARVTALKAVLETAEDERERFDAMIGKGRHSVREAKKYVSPAVALPHWEDALRAFTALAKQFPKRADEFALELKEVQENRDKAYLYVNFGVVPAPAQPKELPARTGPGASGTPAAPAAPVAPKPRTRLPDPNFPGE